MNDGTNPPEQTLIEKESIRTASAYVPSILKQLTEDSVLYVVLHANDAEACLNLAKTGQAVKAAFVRQSRTKQNLHTYLVPGDGK